MRRRCCCRATECQSHADCIAGGPSTTSVYLSISGGTWEKRLRYGWNINLNENDCDVAVPSLNGDYVLTGGAGFWYYIEHGIIPGDFESDGSGLCCVQWSLYLLFRTICEDGDPRVCTSQLGFVVYPTQYGLSPAPDFDFRQGFAYAPSQVKWPLGTSEFSFNYRGPGAGEWGDSQWQWGCPYAAIYHTPYAGATQPPATLTVGTTPP